METNHKAIKTADRTWVCNGIQIKYARDISRKMRYHYKINDASYRSVSLSGAVADINAKFRYN